jgi:thioredoxin 1
MRLTDATFEQEVYQSDIPVFVDFWASWCPPCKMMEPVIELLEKEYEGRVKVCKINIDRNPQTTARFNIKGVPTFIIYRNGEIIARSVAAKSEDELRDMINQVV